MTSELVIRTVLIVSTCTTFWEVTCDSLTDWHYMGENIALNKSTEQTPGTFEVHYPSYKRYPGSLAVDGDDSNNFEHGSCSHTTRSPFYGDVPIASWKVFLGGLFNVTGIVIVNRKGQEDRLKGFILYGAQKRPNWQTIYDDHGKNSYKNDTIYISLDGNAAYSIIAINLPKHRGNPDNSMSYLTLCEVKIYAAPLPVCDINKVQVSNGYAEVYQNTGRLVNQYYTVGTILKVKCNGNLLINGSVSVECLSTGEYTQTFPTCIDACPGFQNTTNIAKVSPKLQLYRANTAVTFFCKYGYKTVYSNPIICQSGGKWNSPMPLCQPVKCPHLTKPKNGYYIINQPVTLSYTSRELEFETEITGECDTGYESNNYQKRVCQINETWSGQETVCTPVLCNHPGNITNGAYVFNNSSKVLTEMHFSYKTVLQTSCDKGYTLRGQAERSCQSNKTWSGKEPYCDIVRCDFPGPFDNGHYGMRKESITQKEEIIPYIKDKLSYSIEIEVICVKGYILNSSEIVRQCTSEGVWTGKIPVCVPVFCQWPISIKHGYYKASQNETTNGMPYNTTLTAFCHNNYKLMDEYQLRRCNERAVWDQEPAACISSLMQNQKSSIDAGLIGGLSSTVIVLLIIAVMTFLLYRRRKTLRSKKERPLQFSHLQRQDNEPDRPTHTPDYAYVDIDHSTDTSKVKATRERTDRSSEHSKTSGVYSTAVPDQAVMLSFGSSGSLQSDQAYYSFSDSKKIPATAVKINDLPDLILTGDAAKKKLQKEFESLPNGMVGAYNEAMKLENRGKNRYKNLYAYDDTRVVLDTDDGSKSKSDYINACYVHGFNQIRKYIASQGPTSEILDDFWRMIWQTQCSKIVMLTNLIEEGKTKCEHYWPDEGSHTYDRIKVGIDSTERFSQFVIRKLTVKKDNSPKKTVLQFHFTAWPDRGVPKYTSSIVQFLSKVKYAPSYGKGPVIVHCSAGVGRTGTFIALDNVTEQGKELGYVDVAGVVEAMRKQRVSSVQTLDQYIFVYQAAVETLMLSTSAMPAAKFQEAFQELLQTDAQKKKKKIYLEFETLKKMSPVAEECQYVSSKLVRNRRKNRYSNVLPIEEFMPDLTKMDGSEDTEYINAVFLPSYKEKKAFIITQTPLESTTEDFWRLIWEHEIHTLVMMNSHEEMAESEVYWPNVNESLTFGNIVIKNDGIEEMNKYRVLSLSVKKFLLTRHIRLIHCGGWKSHRKLPESPEVILSAMELVQTWQQQTRNHTVLVHCMNGVDKSGLFCVISAVIERMKIEQDVAISHVVEEMRNAREQIIPSVEQYQFCHEAVLAYIHQFDTYSNFKA